MVQLKQFPLAEESADYLALAVGNTWTYTWAKLPSEYAAKDVYRVGASGGADWLLEHHAYCIPTE